MQTSQNTVKFCSTVITFTNSHQSEDTRGLKNSHRDCIVIFKFKVKKDGEDNFSLFSLTEKIVFWRTLLINLGKLKCFLTNLSILNGNIILWNDFKAKDIFTSWPDRSSLNSFVECDKSVNFQPLQLVKLLKMSFPENLKNYFDFMNLMHIKLAFYGFDIGVTQKSK